MKTPKNCESCSGLIGELRERISERDDEIRGLEGKLATVEHDYYKLDTETRASASRRAFTVDDLNMISSALEFYMSYSPAGVCHGGAVRGLMGRINREIRCTDEPPSPVAAAPATPTTGPASDSETSD